MPTCPRTPGSSAAALVPTYPRTPEPRLRPSERHSEGRKTPPRHHLRSRSRRLGHVLRHAGLIRSRDLTPRKLPPTPPVPLLAHQGSRAPSQAVSARFQALLACARKVSQSAEDSAVPHHPPPAEGPTGGGSVMFHHAHGNQGAGAARAEPTLSAPP